MMGSSVTSRLPSGPTRLPRSRRQGGGSTSTPRRNALSRPLPFRSAGAVERGFADDGARLVWVAPAGAQPKHPPITIVINQSPWFGGFKGLVEAYEKQTGNRVTLDVNPFAGTLEKQRNSVRAKDGTFDLLPLNGFFFQEFYVGGFLTPLNELDPGFQLDPQVATLDDTPWWDEKTKTVNRKTGKLMTVPINPNIPLLYYRKDLYDKAGLKAPTTFDELLDNAKKLHNPPQVYGIVQRGSRETTGVTYDFLPYLYGHGGSILKDEKVGDFTVTINSPEARRALDLYLRLAKEASHPNPGGQGQAQVIQNLVTGKAAHGILVIAAWSQMDDPTKSAVVGKLEFAVPPHAPGHPPGPGLGHFLGGIPRNVPRDRQLAALAFLKWFQTREAQVIYSKAGSGTPGPSDGKSCRPSAGEDWWPRMCLRQVHSGSRQRRNERDQTARTSEGVASRLPGCSPLPGSSYPAEH